MTQLTVVRSSSRAGSSFVPLKSKSILVTMVACGQTMESVTIPASRAPAWPTSYWRKTGDMTQPTVVRYST